MGLELKRQNVQGISCGVVNGLHVASDGTTLRPLGHLVVVTNSNTGEQTLLKGHDGDIVGVAMSPDRKFYATAQKGPNADVIVWDVEKRKLLYRLSEYDAAVSVPSFSSDSKLLATIGPVEDNKVIFWDMRTGFIVTSSALKEEFYAASWSPVRDGETYRLAAVGKNCISLWNIDPFVGQFVAKKVELGQIQRDFISATYSRSGDGILCGSTSGDLIRVGTAQLNIQGKSSVVGVGGVRHSLMTDKGLLLATGDGTICLFEDGQTTSLCKAEGGVMSLAHGIEEHVYVLYTNKGIVYELNIESMSLKEIDGYNTSGVSKIALVNDSVCVACCDDGTVSAWDTQKLSLRNIFIGKDGHGHRFSVTSIFATEDMILTGWENGQIRALHPETLGEIWNLANTHNGPVTAIANDVSSKFMITGGHKGQVKIWRMANRCMVASLHEHSREITSLKLIADDTKLISASKDSAFITWDLMTQQRVATHRQRTGAINDMAVMENDMQVMTVGRSDDVNLWDLREHQPLSMIEGAHKGEICCICMSPTGKYFATGGTDSEVKVWDTETLSLAGSGLGHSGKVTALAFTSDGDSLVSSSDDGSLTKWNIT